MEECICKEQLNIERVYLHLLWCPQGYSVKEYDKLPWYKKLFRIDPRSYDVLN